MNKPQLERKTDLCMQLLNVAEKLDPEFGVLRVTMLRELADCLYVRKLSRETVNYWRHVCIHSLKIIFQAKNKQYIRIIEEANRLQEMEMEYLKII